MSNMGAECSTISAPAGDCKFYQGIATTYVVILKELIERLTTYRDFPYEGKDYLIMLVELVTALDSDEFDKARALLASMDSWVEEILPFDAGDVISRTLIKTFAKFHSSFKQNLIDNLKKACPPPKPKERTRAHSQCSHCKHPLSWTMTLEDEGLTPEVIAELCRENEELATPKVSYTVKKSSSASAIDRMKANKTKPPPKVHSPINPPASYNAIYQMIEQERQEKKKNPSKFRKPPSVNKYEPLNLQQDNDSRVLYTAVTTVPKKPKTRTYYPGTPEYEQITEYYQPQKSGPITFEEVDPEEEGDIAINEDYDDYDEYGDKIWPRSQF